MAKNPSGGDTTTAPQRRPKEALADRPLLICMSGADVGAIFPLGDRVVYMIGRDAGADIPLNDSEISRDHAVLCFDPKSGSFSLRDLGSRNGTSVNGRDGTLESRAERRLEIGDKIQLGNTILRLSLSSEDEARYASRMQEVALRDALTGAFNRRFFDECLLREIASTNRHGTPLALLLADVDHFKQINDEHGHTTGDVVLREIVRVFQEGVRAEDCVARYGGEEIAVVCRQTDEAGAFVLAERLRQAVAAAPGAVSVTVSIGVAAARESGAKSADALIAAADGALYEAKRLGRNRCERQSGKNVSRNEP